MRQTVLAVLLFAFSASSFASPSARMHPAEDEAECTRADCAPSLYDAGRTQIVLEKTPQDLQPGTCWHIWDGPKNMDDPDDDGGMTDKDECAPCRGLPRGDYYPHSQKGITNATINAAKEYIIDCWKYPQVCENWCYYVFCKNNGHDSYWTTHVNKENKAAKRAANSCGSARPNKCSVNAGLWPAFPQPNFDCDEQPKASNKQGGAGAATRCMTRTENRGEGCAWGWFLKKEGLGHNDEVRVKLTNVDAMGACGPMNPILPKNCVAPATPANRVDNLRRQE